ncbi:EAL domain-containing protein [Marinobacter sp. M3C]|jgi:diguanylate cyclase (GGDEF)-like protein/PAS domain S-box-containing protein|uniref:sensor domain-containing protein n=1 Tax=unclassified Marinobacter TaxID=83889 RepID=UPI0020105798|nr:MULTISPECIES: bifunctional diguanylate cyclase/phosphodiesterase [unclassified Marinobacter]MCL1477980.1 EAL domain-containing protein [Marinobacter sp.]MCL1480456.1 EAL domain-containing protein [Marinobacter sp.]UQG56338.1 EAL domain-containing protein [Marinobacter sp. M4C]UQG58390.1 EAL domain-containing protein [Marinobacter sp. M3C]UQG65142.1 EAL domain-containing protein [Marinobacter sp. M2C]
MLLHHAATRDSIRQLFDAVKAISVQGYDEERRVVYWNVGSELLYGYTEAEALGRKLEELIIPECMCNVVVTSHKRWVDEGVEIPASEIILRNKNGQDVSVFSSHVLFEDENNKKEMYCIDIDLAEVRQAQAQVIFKENMLKAVFEATPDLFFLMQEDGTIIDYYVGDKKNLYVLPKDILGKSMSDFLPEKVVKNFKSHFVKIIEQGGVSSFEYELSMPHGLTQFEARIIYLQSDKKIVVIVRDITEQHKAAEVIRKHAYFDNLTSLPNRFLSLDRLWQMLKKAKRNADNVAVFFLDLDDFKKVNDSLGHEVGDKLLVEAANRLKLVVRESDTVGRLGGDEFIVLSQALTNGHDAIDIAENLLGIFREPFKIDGRELSLTVSIGIAIYPENGGSASDLLRNADTAMYQAKTLGRNAYSFFTRAMNDITLRRLEIEGYLHYALERDEFEVYYQPKVNIVNGNIIGAEALLRWHNPVLGNVTPDEFIPIAEHTGLIVPIGEYVVQQALDFLGDWQSAHQKNYTIAVNLSPRQFRDKKLIDFIKKSLNNANIKPESLEFEVTEGVLMIGNSYIDGALAELHKLGVKLSMDDFGTGYSSLSYLRKYSFDVLKIDRSFVSGITLKKSDCNLVKATIAMAHSLGLLVVAEGVEMREQLTLLEELGCDLAQGYYFSKPIPAKELIDFQYAANRP